MEPKKKEPRNRTLEICAESIMYCKMAEEGGADRIELCQALELGGITPSIGLVKMAKKSLSIPIFVMIRPRGGDFTYCEEEVEQMEEDMRACLELQVDGFVTGALRNGEIDEEVCSRLIEAAYGLPVTFHRAYDVSTDDNALAKIMDLGFKRLLTSGQAVEAPKGRKKIRKLIREADARMKGFIIMPGCGINDENMLDMVQGTNASEYHSSGQGHSRPVLSSSQSVVKGTSAYPLPTISEIKGMKDTLNMLNNLYFTTIDRQLTSIPYPKINF